jgi:threonine synthase
MPQRARSGGDSVAAPASTLACAGCGAPVPDGARPYPFRCARADDSSDVDHVVRRTLDPAAIRIDRDRDHPFLRYREFLHSYHLARAGGLADAAYVDLVTRLDEAIARVCGRGFRITPLRRSAGLEAQLGIEPPGSLWIKDETQNVSGSHKARHLMGVMLYLHVVEALGLDDPRRRGLAIASCGNAALAAAVIARATGYPLRVFVPSTADPDVKAHIESLGAAVEICPRPIGAGGDPSYRRFRQALAEGALPFCCQGPENGLTIEGGETLWLEALEAWSGAPPDRVFVQVGGGALASACVQALADLRATGRVSWQPRVHAVQTCGASPLERAYRRVVERLADLPAGRARIDTVMQYARAHRSAFMRCWDVEPHSIAHGILDDETYDWAAIVEGMLQSDGYPVVVDDEELAHANRLARAAAGIAVDHTGSAGLAGLMQVLARDPSARRDRTLALFSGIDRSAIR